VGAVAAANDPDSFWTFYTGTNRLLIRCRIHKNSLLSDENLICH